MVREKRLFTLSELETSKSKSWIKKHLKTCPEMVIRYVLTMTGIGNGVEVSCAKCGKYRNVTDYESW